MTVQRMKTVKHWNEATSTLPRRTKIQAKFLYDDLFAQIAIPIELDAEGNG